MPMRILIVDDHGVLRAGLKALIENEQGLAVVGEAGEGTEALRLAQELKPDLVLLDISLPGMDGLEITRRLHADLPQTRVLILTLHEDESMMREALQAGAAGYIVKRAVQSELISAIRAAGEGHMYVHPTMMRALVRDLAPAESTDVPAERLTPREAQVLSLVAQGYTSRQVADQLCLSIRTVDSHRANIMSKLNLTSRADIVRYAKEHHLMM